jgi:hypothetical protein
MSIQNMVQWIYLFLGVEAALVILIVVRLAKPRRRANVLPLKQRSSANTDRDRIDRAA